MLKTVKQNGKIYALVPIEEYEHMLKLSLSEDEYDAVLFQEAMELNEEAFPIDIFDAIDAGQHPIRVLRQYRNMTQKTLADLVGISVAYLAQIETGKRDGTRVAKTIAQKLNVPTDMILG